ncbi:MAG: UvrD-helicase domain-containing protein [Nitrospirae bacterium]|nr:UvrD-helicase domain-containing protein [Nitrospirota bacterium]MBF0542388.1 UvrD-helicase domain-containing protein [Nitrospirota bacterium]
MNDPVIIKDSEMTFPHFTLLKASAGSGKTYTLTKRYVQFLLSNKIKFNKLPSILAITFSNNAAKEMKSRILKWLKEVSLNNIEMTSELASVLSIPESELCQNANDLIDEIINNYSDFGVMTIDSFMTSVFKASAIDLDFPPDFEILMNNDSIIEYAFNIFLRRVKHGSGEASLMEEIIYSIGQTKNTNSAFLWEPTGVILDEIKQLYKKLSPNTLEFTDRLPDMIDIQRKMTKLINEIDLKIERSNSVRNQKSKYNKFLEFIKNNTFADFAGEEGKTPPINKPKNKLDIAIYDEIISDWNSFNQHIRAYTVLFSETWYLPYLKVLREFNHEINKVKKQQEKVFIEDINRELSDYINSDRVPDVYFRIGETIYHYLIDEFQDTSPLQWQNLFPLIENSLSVGGSLFCVGDTKQAIYGFRDADYTIMKSAEEQNPFPSSTHMVNELDINYRSKGRIVDFSQLLFKGCLNNDKYANAATQSGLTDYIQRPKTENEDIGHIEIILLNSDEFDEDDEENSQQFLKTIDLINSLKDRGYNYSDIAVLASRNEDVVQITTWLNKARIPFVSYSNLDIRKRKITGEIISLLNFLDSPLDDLSFTTVCIGSIMSQSLKNDDILTFIFKNRRNAPLYKAFQKEYPVIWDQYFSELFTKSGYLPLYDLVTEIYRIFELFDRFITEEATLIKILEVIKTLEQTGTNSLREFLTSALDTDANDTNWNIDLPEDKDAVKVMTIHKSKGLGFEVCIIILREEKKARTINYLIQNSDNKRSPILKINKKIAACDPELQNLYEEALLKERVNSLNTLYVGLTRPKEELYLIGTTSDKKYFPIDLLPIKEYCDTDIDTIHRTPIIKEQTQTAKILHQYVPLKTGNSSQINLNRTHALRGEFIHKVLSYIDYVTDDFFDDLLDKIINDVNTETNSNYNPSEIANILKNFLNNNTVAPYFTPQPNRIVFNEKEFLDSSGIINRMDRVIIDNNTVTILDYKTGGSFDKYQSQIDRYINILKELYPDKKITGNVLYVETF